MFMIVIAEILPYAPDPVSFVDPRKEGLPVLFVRHEIETGQIKVLGNSTANHPSYGGCLIEQVGSGIALRASEPEPEDDPIVGWLRVRSVEFASAQPPDPGP